MRRTRSFAGMSSLPIAKLRSWWWHRQGLDGSLRDATPAAVLERCGWARSVGGAGPYLALFARGGVTRAAADAAVAALAIHELPAARGCTYVVPARDYAIALLAGQAAGDPDLRQAEKLGVKADEVDALCAAVLKAVAKAPLEPEAIRSAVGPLARSLGEAGKKKGLSTTLPLALGRLQAQGSIRRVPVDGRLDQQRYAYVAWPKGPLAKGKHDVATALVEMARMFFASVGPATQGEFAWFAGLGKKATQEVVAPLELVAAAPGSDRLLLPADADAWQAHQPAKKAQYGLVSALDPIAANRRELVSLLEPDAAAVVATLGETGAGNGSLVDLPCHAILDRGRLVGLWEFDPERGEVVWVSFVGKDKALLAAVAATQEYVRDQLGDARSFSLDSPKSRAPRLAALRRLAER